MAAIFAYLAEKLYLCTQISALVKKLLNIREPNVYARHLEAEVIHPLISVIHFDELEKGVRTSLNNYSVYGLFIQREFPQDLSYGVRPVQVSEWSVIAVAPGQIGGREDDGKPLFLNGWAVLWSPELMSKTDLEAHIAEYNFFSYFFTDSLPLEPQEWDAIETLLSALREELKTHTDSAALRNIVVSYLRLILDYCQRAYWRQNARITADEPDVLKRFHALLDKYYYEGRQAEKGLPTVAYCASEMAYSAGYFGDLVKQATGASAKEYIQSYIIRIAKNILMSGRSISETAYMLGFDYPHHFTRMFKNKTGITPGEYMSGQAS